MQQRIKFLQKRFMPHLLPNCSGGRRFSVVRGNPVKNS